jgi:hypothetical protein
VYREVARPAADFPEVSAVSAGKAKSGTVIPAAEVAAQKEQLAACEARIETGLRSAFDAGAALAEIRDSRLYRRDYASFGQYAETRWDMSERQANRAIEAAAVVGALSRTKLSGMCPLPALESHAAALAKVPEDRRPEVWAAVIGQTDGRPTAKAVAETWQALKDPHKDLKAGLRGANATNVEPAPAEQAAPETPATNVEPEPLTVAGQEAGGQVQEPVKVTKPPPAVPDPVPEKPQPCPGCRSKDEYAADLEARIRALEEANRSLTGRLHAALSEARQLRMALGTRSSGDAGRAAEPGPPVAAQTDLEAADSAHSEPEDGARGHCGALDAAKVVIVVNGTRQRVSAPDGEELEWLCREHRALLADRAGAEVIPAPGELLSWETGACQWPAQAEVTA